MSFRQTTCVSLIYPPAHSSEQTNGLKIFAILLKITKLYREDIVFRKPIQLTNQTKSVPPPENLRCAKLRVRQSSKNYSHSASRHNVHLHTLHTLTAHAKRASRFNSSQKHNGFSRRRHRQCGPEQAVRSRQAGTPAIRHERGTEG